MTERSSSLTALPPAQVFGALLAATLVTAAVLGALVGISEAPELTALGLGACALVAAIAVKPVAGAWLWLLVGPLIVGVARGEAIPFARPNELLLLIAVLGVAANSYWRMARGEAVFPKLGAVDAAVVLLFVTGSIFPLLLLYGRGGPVTAEDVLYALVLAKYFVLFCLFRVAVRTADDVAWCLRLALLSGVVVALIAVLQVGSLFGVVEFLSAFYDDPFEGSSGATILRGSSTIASAFGLADMMAMLLAVVIGWLAAGTRARLPLILAALAFAAGGVAAGSFSGVIGCAVAVLAAAFVTRRLALYLALSLPAAFVASIVFFPVIAARLAGFDNLNALPRSWVGRFENLRRFFWPELFSGTNWLWGVRPAARVAAPETWRSWVYIESGHTWLLWSGGVMLLLSFFAFTWIALRRLFAIARSDRGPIGVAACGAFAGTAMIFVLMLFDPHLTVRGSADLFFPLVALALVNDPRFRQPPAEGA
jgi:hypothetical protein